MANEGRRTTGISSDSFEDDMKSLRHDYLHFSACFGSVLGCNEPQFTDDDIILGTRKREVCETLTPPQLSELKAHGVPSGISDHYGKQYKWELSGTGQINGLLYLKALNGEEEFNDFVTTSNVRPSRGLPKSISVYWDTKTGLKYEADIRFDEAEITAAYKKLSAEKVDHPMQLHLEISDNPRVIHTSLKDANYVILLNKSEVKTYSRR